MAANGTGKAGVRNFKVYVAHMILSRSATVIQSRPKGGHSPVPWLSSASKGRPQAPSRAFEVARTFCDAFRKAFLGKRLRHFRLS